MADKALRDLGAKIQIKRVPLGVFSMFHFAPPVLSSDMNQPGTIKNHKNQHGTINNHKTPSGTVKNQPGTMKNRLEL